MNPDLVQYGNTNLMVSRVCQGTAFRNMPRSLDNETGQRVLRHCLDAGLNFFDTAPGYGAGGAESLLGKALAGRRHEAVIANRVINIGVPPGSKEGDLLPPSRYTSDYIFASVDWSLQRLGTDYLDILSIHKKDGLDAHRDPEVTQRYRDLFGDPEPTPFAEIAETMDAVVRSGKVRYWGLSQYDAAEVTQYLDLSEAAGTAPISSLQNPYNLTLRDSATEKLFPVIRKAGLGVQTIGPHAAGNLTINHNATPDSPLDKLHTTIDKVANTLSVTRSQICIAWVLSHQPLTTTLAGAESEPHVNDNLAGACLELPQEALDQLNTASLEYATSTS